MKTSIVPRRALAGRLLSVAALVGNVATMTGPRATNIDMPACAPHRQEQGHAAGPWQAIARGELSSRNGVAWSAVRAPRDARQGAIGGL